MIGETKCGKYVTLLINKPRSWDLLFLKYSIKVHKKSHKHQIMKDDIKRKSKL